jgi:hypothetical protein
MVSLPPPMQVPTVNVVASVTTTCVPAASDEAEGRVLTV